MLLFGLMARIVVILLGAYIVVTIVLLSLYTNEQYSKEQNSPETQASMGAFTVGFSIAGLLTAVFAIKFIIDRMLGLTNQVDFNLRAGTAFVLMILGIIVCQVLSISSFGLHCGYSTCFNMETPLYIPVLVHVFLFFGFLGIVIIVYTIEFICWLACGVNIEVLKYFPYGAVEPVDDPNAVDLDKLGNVIIRGDVINNLYQFGLTTNCSICLVDHVPNKKINLLGCSHYFHTECIASWLKNNDSCPICKKQCKN